MHALGMVRSARGRCALSRDGDDRWMSCWINESALECRCAALPACRSASRRLNALARRTLERALPLLWVAGEISNFTRAPSGHCYFSLKDERAQVRCVMFRTACSYVGLEPSQRHAGGSARRCPRLYEARGEFQLTVEFMRRAGLGALFEPSRGSRARLEAEGLFAAERKKRPAALPGAHRRRSLRPRRRRCAMC